MEANAVRLRLILDVLEDYQRQMHVDHETPRPVSCRDCEPYVAHVQLDMGLDPYDPLWIVATTPEAPMPLNVDDLFCSFCDRHIYRDAPLPRRRRSRL